MDTAWRRQLTPDSLHKHMLCTEFGIYLNWRNVPKYIKNGPCYFLPSKLATCKGRYFQGDRLFWCFVDYFPESKAANFLDNIFESTTGTNVPILEKIYRREFNKYDSEGTIDI